SCPTPIRLMTSVSQDANGRRNRTSDVDTVLPAIRRPHSIRGVEGAPTPQLVRRRGVLRRPFRPDVAAGGVDWNRPLQRESRDAAWWRWGRRRLMIGGRRTSHLVPAHVRGHVFVERRDIAVGPVLVEDVERQRVAFDLEIIERGHRVRVVTRAAYHAAELVADLLDDEELLGCADAESQPHTDDIFLG